MTRPETATPLEPEPGSTGVIATPEFRLSVAITVMDAAWRAAIPEIEAICTRAARWALEPALEANGEIGILLTDDVRVAELNARFRGKETATNVLSFPNAWPDEGDGILMLGDLVLALETVSREAREQGKTLVDHATHLVVHGCLHLIGHDHQEDAEASAMEGLERQILAELGIADPYQEGRPT